MIMNFALIQSILLVNCLHGTMAAARYVYTGLKSQVPVHIYIYGLHRRFGVQADFTR